MSAYTLKQLREIAPAKYKDLDDEGLVREYARINKVPFEQAADYYGVKPRGLAGEMGRQVVGGAAVDLPRMLGQGLKATGIAPEYGQEMVEAADARAYQYDIDRRPERGLVGQALTLGARGLAPMVPAVGAAFLPGGQVVAPTVAATLFGTSAYQDTYEKILEQTGDEEAARSAALRAGAIQGPLEGVATAVGLRALKPVAAAVRGAPTTARVADAMTDTGVLRPIIRGQAINIPTQAGTEALQDVGTELVERAYGGDPEALDEIAKQSALGGFGMALLLSPLGVGGSLSRARNAQRLKEALDPESDIDPAFRAVALDVVQREARRQGVAEQDISAWAAQQVAAEEARAEQLRQEEEKRRSESIDLLGEQAQQLEGLQGGAFDSLEQQRAIEQGMADLDLQPEFESLEQQREQQAGTDAGQEFQDLMQARVAPAVEPGAQWQAMQAEREQGLDPAVTDAGAQWQELRVSQLRQQMDQDDAIAQAGAEWQALQQNIPQPTSAPLTRGQRAALRGPAGGRLRTTSEPLPPAAPREGVPSTSLLPQQEAPSTSLLPTSSPVGAAADTITPVSKVGGAPATLTPSAPVAEGAFSTTGQTSGTPAPQAQQTEVQGPAAPAAAPATAVTPAPAETGVRFRAPTEREASNFRATTTIDFGNGTVAMSAPGLNDIYIQVGGGTAMPIRVRDRRGGIITSVSAMPESVPQSLRQPLFDLAVLMEAEAPEAEIRAAQVKVEQAVAALGTKAAKPQAKQTKPQTKSATTVAAPPAATEADVTPEQEAEAQKAIDELGLRPLMGGAKENLEASVQTGSITVGGRVTLNPRTLVAAVNNAIGRREGTGPSGKLAKATRRFAETYKKYLDAAGNMVPAERKDAEGKVIPLKPMRGSKVRGDEAAANERATLAVAKVRKLWLEAQRALAELGEAAGNNAKNVEAIVRIMKNRIAVEKAALQKQADEIGADQTDVDGEAAFDDDAKEARDAVTAAIRELTELDLGLSRGWAAAKRGNLRNDADLMDVRGGETRTSTEEQAQGAEQPLVTAATQGAAPAPRAAAATGFQGVLNYIRSNGSPFERMIAKAISEVFKNTQNPPKLVFKEGTPQFDPRTNTITMSPTASTEVSLHEGLHAALQWFVYNNPKNPYVVQLLGAVNKVVKFDTKQLSPKAAAVQKVLADLMKGKKELDAVLELVSYGNTLTEFRKALEAMPTDAAPTSFVKAAKDVWNMILATVRRMLSVPQSVASDVIMDSFKLLEEASRAEYKKSRKGGALDAAAAGGVLRADVQSMPITENTPASTTAADIDTQTNAQAAQAANYPSLTAYRSAPGSSLNLTRVLFERLGFGAQGASTQKIRDAGAKAAERIRKDFPALERTILNINSRFGLPPGMDSIIEYFKSNQNTGIIEMERLTAKMQSNPALAKPIFAYLDGDANAFSGVKDGTALKSIADNVRFHMEQYIQALPANSKERALFANLKFSDYLLNPQSFAQLANKSFGLSKLSTLLGVKRRSEASLESFDALLPMKDGVFDSDAPLYQVMETITDNDGNKLRVPAGFIGQEMADTNPPAGLDIDKSRVWKYEGLNNKQHSFVSRITSSNDVRAMAEEGKVDQLSAALLNTMAALSHNYASRNYFRGITGLGRGEGGKPTTRTVVFDSIDEINEVFKGRVITPQNVLQASADEAKNKTIRTLAQRTGVWVQLPAGTAYGDLAGKFVSGPVWSSMMDMHDRSPLFNAQALNDTMRWFKKAKTVYTPATHVNNILTNYSMMLLHGISHKTLRDAASLFARFERNPDGMKQSERDIVQAFYRSGAVLGQYTQTEAKQTIADALMANISPDAGGSMLTRLAEMAKVEQSFAQALKAGENVDARAMELYAAGDNIFRLAAFMNTAGNIQTRDNTKQLTDAQLLEAGIAARKMFLDYDIDARWVRAARQSFLPFVSWSYAIMPVMGRLAIERPWAMVNMMAAVGLMSAVFDGDDDEWRLTGPDQAREKALWGLGPHTHMRVPFLGDDENPVFYNIGKSIPMMALFNPPPGESKLFGQSWIPGFITPGGPYVNLISGMFLGIDPFTGKKLSDETDSDFNKLLNSAESVYNTMTPSFAQSKFFGNIADIAQGKVGPTGVEPDALFLARTLGGMSLYEFNRTETDFFNDLEVKRIKREFGTVMSKAKRDEYNKGYPDYEALDTELADLRARMEKRIAEIRGEE